MDFPVPRLTRSDSFAGRRGNALSGAQSKARITHTEGRGTTPRPLLPPLFSGVRGKKSSPKSVSTILHRDPVTPMESAASRI